MRAGCAPQARGPDSVTPPALAEPIQQRNVTRLSQAPAAALPESGAGYLGNTCKCLETQMLHSESAWDGRSAAHLDTVALAAEAWLGSGRGGGVVAQPCGLGPRPRVAGSNSEWCRQS